jgi:hypothetical protein
MDGWEVVNKTVCLKLHRDEPRTWQEAVDVCEKEGGFLLWDPHILVSTHLPFFSVSLLVIGLRLWNYCTITCANISHRWKKWYRIFTYSYLTLLALVQTQAVAEVPQFRQSLASDGGWSQSRGRLVVWLGSMVSRNGRWTFADELAGTRERQHNDDGHVEEERT